MNDRTKAEIRNYLQNAEHRIIDQQLDVLEANGYKHDDVVALMKSFGMSDGTAGDVADNVNAIKQKQEITQVTKPLPKELPISKNQPPPLPGLPPIVAPPRSNPPPTVVQLPTDVPEVERRDGRRWVTIGASAMVAALIVLGLALMFTRCDGTDKMGTSISSGDEAADFDPRDPNDLEALRKDVDALKNDHVSKADLSAVDKKVDGAIESTAKLSGAVDQLANQVTTIAEKVNEIDCLLDEKAEKKDVDKMRRRVKRVERKINVHVNNEVTVVDPYPDQPEPVKPPGTVTVIVRKVPVDN